MKYVISFPPTDRKILIGTQLAQDDEGFEIASFGGSLDEEDARSPDMHTPRSGNGATGAAGANGALSPVQPTPTPFAGW